MLQGWLQIGITLILIVAIAPIFGSYIAKVYLGQKTLLDPVLNPIEGLIFRFSGINPENPKNGWQYAGAILYSNLVMAIFLFLMLMLHSPFCH